MRPEAKPIRVLLIDDSPSDRYIVERSLQRDTEQTYEFDYAGKALEGLERIVRTRPDCVIIDYRMPDATGIEVLRRLRKEYRIRSIPVVMVTSSVDEALATEALREGAQDYLLKDLLTFDSLRRAVHNAVEKARSMVELEDALRARDEFLSVVSHELRTPLTTLTLQMQYGQMQLASLTSAGLSAEQVAPIERVLASGFKQSQNMARLINDLLDITRFGSNRFTLNVAECDLAALIQEVVARMREIADIPGPEIMLDLESPLRGTFDSFRIEQIVVNLVTNAIKYGQGAPIHVTLRRDGADHALISVRDEGPGIAPELRERIFDRFERAGAERGKAGGLGLGLHIVRQIAELHGGRAWVESGPGRGANFQLRLPLTPPSS